MQFDLQITAFQKVNLYKKTIMLPLLTL